MNQEETQTNKPEEKDTNDYVNALHSRYEVDRLYVKKRKREKTVSIEDYIDASIQGLKKYTQKCKEKLFYNSNGNIEKQQNSNGKKTTV